MREEVLPSELDLGAFFREVAGIRQSLLQGKHRPKVPRWLIELLFRDLDSAIREDRLPRAHSRFALAHELTTTRLLKRGENPNREGVYDKEYEKVYKAIDESLREIANNLSALNNDKINDRLRLAGGYAVLVREFGTPPERFELELAGPLHHSQADNTDENIRLVYRVTVLADSRQRIREFQRLLVAWGLPSHPELADFDLVKRLFGAQFAIGDILIDYAFPGFIGVDSSRILVEPTISDSPRLPSYVYDVRRQMPEPYPNKPKAYLSQWSPAVIDRGHGITLHTGHRDSAVTTGRYDYWTTTAVVASVPRIQQDLLSGRLELQELPRRLDHVLVVVTSDRKVVLARRGKSDVVDNLSGSWMATVGESVDGNKDRDRSGAANPILAVSRCLLEYDELNLEQSDLDGARITYLGLATEWAFMYVNLLILVELAVGSDRVLDRALPGENRAFATVDFTPDVCLPIIRSGFFQTARFHRPNPFVPASRVALLLGLFARFGEEVIKGRIAAEVYGA